MLIPSSVVHRPQGSSYTALGSLVSSCVFDLDTTISASYGGTGQTWANIEPTPADGAVQTAYNFHLGATSGSSTDDPTFTGSAGSSSAYFLFDGGDFFQIAGGNTSFINSLHKTTGGTDWTFVIAAYFVEESAARYVFDTHANTVSVGMGFRINSTESLTLFQRGDSGSSSQTPAGTVVTATPFLLGIGYNQSTNRIKAWAGSSTAGTEGAGNFNTTSANATAAFQIGRFGGASNFLGNGCRVYAVSMFNTYLTNSEMASVLGEYETRHARDYGA